MERDFFHNLEMGFGGLGDHVELMRLLLGFTYVFLSQSLRKRYVGAIIAKNQEWLPGMASWEMEAERFLESRYVIRFQDGQESSVGAWWSPLLVRLIIFLFLRNWK